MNKIGIAFLLILIFIGGIVVFSGNSCNPKGSLAEQINWGGDNCD